MLEREEEMQTDGADASPDQPATPKILVHPEDPLLAESRPSTANAGEAEVLPQFSGKLLLEIIGEALLHHSWGVMTQHLGVLELKHA